MLIQMYFFFHLIRTRFDFVAVIYQKWIIKKRIASINRQSNLLSIWFCNRRTWHRQAPAGYTKTFQTCYFVSMKFTSMNTYFEKLLFLCVCVCYFWACFPISSGLVSFNAWTCSIIYWYCAFCCASFCMHSFKILMRLQKFVFFFFCFCHPRMLFVGQQTNKDNINVYKVMTMCVQKDFNTSIAKLWMKKSSKVISCTQTDCPLPTR